MLFPLRPACLTQPKTLMRLLKIVSRSSTNLWDQTFGLERNFPRRVWRSRRANQPGAVSGSPVNPRIKKHSVFRNTQITLYSSHPVHAKRGARPIVNERIERLRLIAEEQSFAFRSTFIGETVEVIVERDADGRTWRTTVEPSVSPTA